MSHATPCLMWVRRSSAGPGGMRLVPLTIGY